MIKLEKDRENLLSFFEHAPHHLGVRAALLGEIESIVLVDSEIAQSVAIIYNPGSQGVVFLAGNPDNSKFNQGLMGYLRTELKENSEKVGNDAYQIYAHPAWDETVENVLLVDRNYVTSYDWYYYEEAENISTEIKLDPKYRMEDVSKKEEIIIDIRSYEGIEPWPSFEDFLDKGFASVVYHEDQVVAGCKAVYVLGESCELGIGTREGYRKQGLARSTALDVIRKAKERGIKKIFWECWFQNIASQKTAESIGLHKIAEAKLYYTFFDNRKFD